METFKCKKKIDCISQSTSFRRDNVAFNIYILVFYQIRMDQNVDKISSEHVKTSIVTKSHCEIDQDVYKYQYIDAFITILGMIHLILISNNLINENLIFIKFAQR